MGRTPDQMTPLEKALRSMPLAQAEATLELLEKLCRNTATQPAEEKFRKIRLSNEKIKAAVKDVPGALDALFEMGWQLGDEDSCVLPAGVKLTMHEHVAKIIDARQYYKKEVEKAKKSNSARMQAMVDGQAVGA